MTRAGKDNSPASRWRCGPSRDRRSPGLSEFSSRPPAARRGRRGPEPPHCPAQSPPRRGQPPWRGGCPGPARLPSLLTRDAAARGRRGCSAADRRGRTLTSARHRPRGLPGPRGPAASPLGAAMAPRQPHAALTHAHAALAAQDTQGRLLRS